MVSLPPCALPALQPLLWLRLATGVSEICLKFESVLRTAETETEADARAEAEAEAATMRMRMRMWMTMTSPKGLSVRYARSLAALLSENVCLLLVL